MRRFLLLLLLLILPGQFQGQGLSDPALQAAIRAAQQAVPDFQRPTSWEFEILLPTKDSALSCPLVPGVQLAEAATPYVVTLFSTNSTPYVVHVSEDGSRAQPCDEKFPGMGMQAAATMPPSTAPDQCNVQPSGPFANVRTAPDVDAPLLGTIEAAQPALGRDADWTWYLTLQGWVAGTVVTTSGNCLSNDLGIRDPDIALSLGGGSSDDTNQATPPQTDTICPEGFTGYLPPRIRTGAVTAQVEPGGLPNSLRAQPTTSAERVGTIQPGRRIDQVINGPRCSGTFVWWQVTVDGVTGWTAESNAADDTYYLAPTPGNEVAQPPTNSAPTTLAPTTPITFQNAPGLTLAAERPAGTADMITRIRANKQYEYATFATPEATSTLYRATYPADPAPLLLGELTEGGSLSVLAYDPEEQLLFMGIDLARSRLAVYDRPATEAFNFSGANAAHEGIINAMAVVPGQNRIVTGSRTEVYQVRFWDKRGLDTNQFAPQLIRSLLLPYAVQDVAASDDGEYVAVLAVTQSETTSEGGIWVYGEGGMGENILVLGLDDPNPTNFIAPVPQRQPGHFIYSESGTLYQLDVLTNTQAELLARSAVLRGADFNPANPDMLAIAGIDGVEVYNYNSLINNADSIPVATLPGSAEAVFFSEEGTVLSVLQTDGAIKFYQP